MLKIELRVNHQTSQTIFVKPLSVENARNPQSLIYFILFIFLNNIVGNVACWILNYVKR